MPVRRYFTLVAFATVTLLAGPTASARTQLIYDIIDKPITYSMTYRDSLVLKYNGTKIHRNYNKWIKLIERIADQRFASE